MTFKNTEQPILVDEAYKQAFEKAEFANFGQDDLNKYENSLKVYRDLKGVINTAFDEGKIARSVEIAKQAKSMGLSVYDISKLTGLSEDEISRS